MGLLANLGAVPDAIANYAQGLPPNIRTARQ